MNWLRRLLLAWLFGEYHILAQLEELHESREVIRAEVSALRCALQDAISEINTLRNARAEQPEQQPVRQVRRARSWSDFRAAAEGRQPDKPDKPVTVRIS